MRTIDAELYLKEKGYKSSIHNFEILQNKMKFVSSFEKIGLEEYIKNLKGTL